MKKTKESFKLLMTTSYNLNHKQRRLTNKIKKLKDNNNKSKDNRKKLIN